MYTLTYTPIHTGSICLFLDAKENTKYYIKLGLFLSSFVVFYIIFPHSKFKGALRKKAFQKDDM